MRVEYKYPAIFGQLVIKHLFKRSAARVTLLDLLRFSHLPESVYEVKSFVVCILTTCKAS